jgi:VIT1/CCC1 family predicted Fe2+/Mn2+ transporter
MSMAAGEYVSVCSQADIEAADLLKEGIELQRYPAAELRELADIYVSRGITRKLATQVAKQSMKHDSLGTACQGRTGHLQHAKSPSVSGCLGLCRQFFHWSRLTAGCNCHCNCLSIAALANRINFAILGNIRRRSRANRRRQPITRGMAGNFLGGNRYVDYCGGR